ncbi:Aldehyde/histidinol dehydrogenase [Endogone sp. FLAS-F59071]|nr:Aldehyde/histidinol dehydrogenase [Endogone sp. FLAS-F59071]|eukprot:RUS13530.1 Aldehyde/histidinol dehydrogenase [Endogone sp. FLAS-F59071]
MGSTIVGCMILKASAESNLKKVTLELGGKSPNIIFDDADLDQAVKWAHLGVFNHGQTCCVGSRVYVEKGIYDEFLRRFKQISQNIKIGDPFEKTTFRGPQVSETQYNHIMSYIDLKEGAKIEIGGGPVVALSKFKTVEEVIEKAHMTTYGFAVAVFTNVTKAIKVSNALKAGTVWVNCYGQIDCNTPLGYRQSRLVASYGTFF